LGPGRYGTDHEEDRTMINRRSVLLGGLAGLGAALVGCSGPVSPPSAPSAAAPGPSSAAGETATRRLAGLEARFGGRLGVFALDTGSGATVGHRADERFLLCSTSKAFGVSAVLNLSLREPGLLERRITYTSAQVVSYSPVTGLHVGAGMTVAELCAAALTVSDNTAHNLLLGVLGGPAALTGFVRGLGDPLTRFDRWEPRLNVTSTGDERDTGTPSWLVRDLRSVTLGTVLPPGERDRLVGWLTANTTGAQQIRAGVPAGWRVADKTGSGAQGESNDLAVVWPPGRAPLVIAVYTAPTDPANQTGKATIAAATAAAVSALAPAGAR
jgi:beta-lactamase class A